MKYYIVFDSRAEYDEDAASIYECLGEMSREKAIQAFRREWGDSDGVLFEYDTVNEKELINGKRVHCK